MDKWKKENEKALLLCDKLIFPSESAREVMVSIFPSIEEKTVVIPHGSDLVKSGRSDAALQGPFEKSRRVHTHLDQVPGTRRGFNYVTGWAYLEGLTMLR